jgi:GTPase SAR1 family protein
VFENYVGYVTAKDTFVQLGVWDTAGFEDYDRLRPLSYRSNSGGCDTDVILLCYSIDNPDSLDNIQEKVRASISRRCLSRDG